MSRLSAPFLLAIVAFASSSEAATVALGAHHAVVIDSSGNVWTWGQNTYGQLGNGTTVPSAVPIRVTTLSGIVQVAAGASFTLALKQDGTVWAWGLNAYGQLGDGTSIQ